MLIALAAGIAADAPPASGQGAAPRPDVFAVSAHLWRFWDSTGAPIAVVQYAVLTHTPPHAVAAPVTAVTLTFQQFGAGHQMRDSSWTQRFDHRADRPTDRFGSGVMTVPLGPRIASWRLAANDSGPPPDGAGDVFAVQPLPTGSIVVSDLAFGVPGHADIWQSGGEPALLGESGVFDRAVPIHVFYQVRSDAQRDEAVTWLTCTDITDPRVGRRVMQANFATPLRRGINAVERLLDMSRMKPGRYQVELQAGDPHGGGASVRMATFTLR